MARPKRTTALTRDAIVDEAIDIVSTEGLSALTMPRCGSSAWRNPYGDLLLRCR